MNDKQTIYKDFKTWLVLWYIKGNSLLNTENKDIWFIDSRNFQNISIYFTIKWENKYVAFIDNKGNFISQDAKLLLSFSRKLGCYYDLEWNWQKLLNSYFS